MNNLLAFLALAVIPTVVGADEHQPKFSDKPIWVSGSQNCGGDGNARLLDIDQDGDLDLVTSAPNPSRWVVFENLAGKLAEEPMWESKATTDCDHISVLDFNQDGLPDLAGTHESHDTLYLNDKSREQRFDTAPD